MVTKIPFQVGDPVIGENFADRQEILTELSNNILSLKKGVRQDFALISPRRMGKSSVLLILKERIEKEFVCIYIDCSKLYPSNLINFLQTYSKQVYIAYSQKLSWKVLPGKIINAIEGVATATLELIQKIGVEIEDIKIWLEFKEKKVNESELLNKVLDLPEKLAKKHNLPCLIILDEFQDITKFGADFLKYLRSIITSHKMVDYIISGSLVSIMSSIVHDKKSPFYNLFIVKSLDMLPRREAETFLEKKFKEFSYEKKAIEKILDLTQCHPFYLQWLARAVFISTLVDKKFTEAEVEKIYDNSLNEPLGHFEYEIGKIKDKGRYMDILTIMAKHDVKTPSKIGRYLNIEAGEVSPYLKKLIEFGFIKKEKEGYEFNDKILKEWIKRRF